MTAKPPAVVSVLACVLTLWGLAACDNGTEEAAGTDSPSTIATVADSAAPIVTMSEPDWWIPPANSVERLFVDHTVVVGKITGVERPFDPAMRLYTIFAVRVETTIRAEKIAEGDTIFVGQTGGIWQSTQYEEQGNSLFREGATYLLTIHPFSGFAVDADFNGYYMSMPFAQFLVESDNLQPKDEVWASLPAVAELATHPLEQARDIVAGLAEHTPITDEQLLAAQNAVPFLPGEVGTRSEVISPMSGSAMGSFSASTTIEDVLAFYEDALPLLGWLSETAQKVVTHPGKDGTGAITTGTWTLTKDDLRLIIVTGLAPKDAPPGEISTQISVEPVWFQGLNSYGIPSICALPSSISGLRPTSSVCGSP